MDGESTDKPGRARRLPSLWVLPLAALAVAALLRPQQVLSAVTSPRVLLIVLAVAASTVLLNRVGRRLPGPAGSVLAAVPGLLAVALLVVPTLRSTSVDEDLAGLVPVSAEPGPGAAGSPAAPVAEGVPARLSTGAVKGIGHRASGSASLVQLPGGEVQLRFEDLDVDPGPDYRVYLVPGSGRTSPGEGMLLSDLKATSGNQNYPLTFAAPAGPLTALIWCEAFSVAIAAASLP